MVGNFNECRRHNSPPPGTTPPLLPASIQHWEVFLKPGQHGPATVRMRSHPPEFAKPRSIGSPFPDGAHWCTPCAATLVFAVPDKAIFASPFCNESVGGSSELVSICAGGGCDGCFCLNTNSERLPLNSQLGSSPCGFVYLATSGDQVSQALTAALNATRLPWSLRWPGERSSSQISD